VLQVTSSRKGAKSETYGRKPRSTGTKASTIEVRKPRADLERQLETYKRQLNGREHLCVHREIIYADGVPLGALSPIESGNARFGSLLCEEADPEPTGRRHSLAQVRERTMRLTGSVCFSDWKRADAGMAALREAGFDVRINDSIDVDGPAVFVDIAIDAPVSETDTLFDLASRLVDPFGTLEEFGAGNDDTENAQRH
jgi:hypothetical protein